MQPQPFTFDTEFDGAGGVITGARPTRPLKRTYLAAEVEALVATAKAEARTQALAEADGLRAQALAEIAQAAADSASRLAAVAQKHREASAELALAAARVLSAEALDAMPKGPLTTAIEALSQELTNAPRLVVRAAGLDDQARAEVEAACAQAGYAGLVAFRDDAGLATAAFVLEWADGRAEYDPEETAARVAAALTAALAAEGGHAESLAGGAV